MEEFLRVHCVRLLFLVLSFPIASYSQNQSCHPKNLRVNDSDSFEAVTLGFDSQSTAEGLERFQYNALTSWYVEKNSRFPSGYEVAAYETDQSNPTYKTHIAPQIGLNVARVNNLSPNKSYTIKVRCIKPNGEVSATGADITNVNPKGSTITWLKGLSSNGTNGIYYNPRDYPGLNSLPTNLFQASYYYSATPPQNSWYSWINTNRTPTNGWRGPYLLAPFVGVNPNEGWSTLGMSNSHYGSLVRSPKITFNVAQGGGLSVYTVTNTTGCNQDQSAFIFYSGTPLVNIQRIPGHGGSLSDLLGKRAFVSVMFSNSILIEHYDITGALIGSKSISNARYATSEVPALLGIELTNSEVKIKSDSNFSGNFIEVGRYQFPNNNTLSTFGTVSLTEQLSQRNTSWCAINTAAYTNHLDVISLSPGLSTKSEVFAVIPTGGSTFTKPSEPSDIPDPVKTEQQTNHNFFNPLPIMNDLREFSVPVSGVYLPPIILNAETDLDWAVNADYVSKQAGTKQNQITMVKVSARNVYNQEIPIFAQDFSTSSSEGILSAEQRRTISTNSLSPLISQRPYVQPVIRAFTKYGAQSVAIAPNGLAYGGGWSVINDPNRGLFSSAPILKRLVLRVSNASENIRMDYNLMNLEQNGEILLHASDTLGIFVETESMNYLKSVVFKYGNNSDFKSYQLAFSSDLKKVDNKFITSVGDNNFYEVNPASWSLPTWMNPGYLLTMKVSDINNLSIPDKIFRLRAVANNVVRTSGNSIDMSLSDTGIAPPDLPPPGAGPTPPSTPTTTATSTATTIAQPTITSTAALPILTPTHTPSPSLTSLTPLQPTKCHKYNRRFPQKIILMSKWLKKVEILYFYKGVKLNFHRKISLQSKKRALLGKELLPKKKKLLLGTQICIQNL